LVDWKFLREHKVPNIVSRPDKDSATQVADKSVSVCRRSVRQRDRVRQSGWKRRRGGRGRVSCEPRHGESGRVEVGIGISLVVLDLRSRNQVRKRPDVIERCRRKSCTYLKWTAGLGLDDAARLPSSNNVSSKTLHMLSRQVVAEVNGQAVSNVE